MSHTPDLSAAQRLANETADAWTALYRAMPRHARKAIQDEVSHRKTLMGERDAVESVYADLTAGRWKP